MNEKNAIRIQSKLGNVRLKLFIISTIKQKLEQDIHLLSVVSFLYHY